VKTTSALFVGSRLCASNVNAVVKPRHRQLRVLHRVSKRSVRRVRSFIASSGPIEARGVCRYSRPSRHHLNQSGLLTSMLLLYDHISGRNLVLLFIVLCIDFYIYYYILTSSCKYNQIDLCTITVKYFVFVSVIL
jgi:hypothetical protein